jgi:hypothetical protein
MRPHDGGVEHLNQVRGAAGCSEGVEEGLEHARLAEAPEALPDGLPVAECLGQRNASGRARQVMLWTAK